MSITRHGSVTGPHAPRVPSLVTREGSEVRSVKRPRQNAGRPSGCHCHALTTANSRAMSGDKIAPEVKIPVKLVAVDENVTIPVCHP